VIAAVMRMTKLKDQNIVGDLLIWSNSVSYKRTGQIGRTIMAKNLRIVEKLFNYRLYQVITMSIGKSDLENVGVDTKINHLG